MTDRMRDLIYKVLSGDRSVLALYAGAFVLFLMSLWVFGAGSFVDRLEVFDAVSCSDLSDSMEPQEVSSEFPKDARQVCVFFRYRSPGEEQVVIIWSHRGRVIQKETLSLHKGDGKKAFYLLREDGSPLPSGDYEVSVMWGIRRLGSVRFRVL
ncbi:MAG: hypothetical protein N2315_06310 [Thermanaerothrix sp.]|nr:hypothetical protein [Thermanaerothrix sp.]